MQRSTWRVGDIVQTALWTSQLKQVGANTRTGCLDGMASMRRRRIAAEEHPHLGQVGVEGARARSHCCAPAQTRVFKGNPLEILEKRGHEGPGANPGNRTPWVHKVKVIVGE